MQVYKNKTKMFWALPMNGSFVNEYTVLYVFCAGVLVQSLFSLRTLKQVFWAVIVMAVCVIPAWFIPEPADRGFATPLCWSVFYAVLFPFVFHKLLLPSINIGVLLFYTILLYYVLYVSARSSGVDVPVSVMVGGMIPGILVILASLLGMLKYKALRGLCYTWYLITLCVMLGCQWSLEDLASIYRGDGFSMELFVYVFLAGGVVLVFFSNMVQLLLLIPVPTRPSHRIVLDVVTGPLTYYKDQADGMAQSLIGRRIGTWGWVIVAAYLALLVINAIYGFIPHGIVINLSFLAVVWFVMPRPQARAH